MTITNREVFALDPAAGFVLGIQVHGRVRVAVADLAGRVLARQESSARIRATQSFPAAVAALAADTVRVAGVDASEIDYISTHGGGVPKQDRGETAAYKAAFGRLAYNIPISSIKPVTGNPFAAGGALQVVAGCLTLAEQFLPPTLNLDVPDAACDLDYVPNQGRMARVNCFRQSRHARRLSRQWLGQRPA